VVDRVFEPMSGQSKNYTIGSCCFSAKHAALGSKNKDWPARNQDNVFKWSNMSTNQACWCRTKRTSPSFFNRNI